MTERKNGKIEYIAQAQLVACLLVILGHSIPLNWKVPEVIVTMDTFLYSFHMPLFFVVSGYLFYKTKAMDRYGYLTYVKKRSIRLLLPYMVFMLLGLLPKFFTKNWFDDGGELSFYYILKNIFVPRENVWGHLWFLPTLFFISLFAFLFAKLKRKSSIVFAVVTVALFALPFIPKLTDWFAIKDVFYHIGFYAIGIAFADSKAEQVVCDTKKNRISLLALPIAIAVFILGRKSGIPEVMMACKELIGISMTFFVFFIAQLFHIMQTLWGAFLTQKTFSIYLLAWPAQCVISLVFEKMLALPYYITMPIAFAAGIAGPIVTILIVDFIEKKANKRFLSPIIGG